MLLLALIALLAAVLVGAFILLRRIQRELDPTIEGFDSFRRALRPALVRVEDASARARRRRNAPDA